MNKSIKLAEKTNTKKDMIEIRLRDIWLLY